MDKIMEMLDSRIEESVYLKEDLNETSWNDQQGILISVNQAKDILEKLKYSKQTAIEFAEWISDNGWIKDPFPQKGFNDDILRYTNIATIDIHSDDKLVILTIEELFEMFEKHQAEASQKLNETK